MAESGRNGGRKPSSGSSRARSSSSAKSTSSRSATARKTSSSPRSAAKPKTAAAKPKAASSASARKSGAASKSQATRSRAASTGGKARGRQQQAQKAAAKATSPLDFSGKSAAELREALTKRVITPLNLIMVTRDRIEDAFEDAVSRGRMTADDAQQLVQSIFTRGRQQTNDVLGDLEQLLGKATNEVDSRRSTARKRGTDAAGRARKQVGEATTRARARAREAADPVIAQADRVRRTAGVGPSFPILGYDDLTAAQVQSRLDGLTPAELRKVRDYEKKHANRKSVLASVESKLS
jgi:polyhydroxyalkanoate synthesis regulator phasin